MPAINMPQPRRNIFLEDMDFDSDSKKDLRGWNYERGCSCWRCQQFRDAANFIIQEAETGVTPPRLEYDPSK